MKNLNYKVLMLLFVLLIILYSVNILPVINQLITILIVLITLLLVGNKISFSNFLIFTISLAATVISIFFSQHIGPLTIFFCIILLNGFSDLKNTKIVHHRDLQKTMIIPIIVFCFILNSFYFVDGRMYGIIKDPNYTACTLFVFISIFDLWFGFDKKSKILIFLLFSATILLTSSRMALLAFFVFYSLKYLILKWKISAIRKIVILLLFIFTSMQFVTTLLFQNHKNNIEWSSYSNDSNRIFTFTDESNLARITAFDQAINFIVDNSLLFNGIPDYMKSNPRAHNIPHHWLLQLIINSGLLLSTLYFFVIIKFIKVVPDTLLPSLASLFLIGSVLGKEPMIIGMFILLSSFLVIKKIEKT
ncbi:O-antigen ligase family protein [Providencia vermicola]|uniref:O-antigen ligase family protein n=1 Tax=Providencia vermicola TaxID=333965 RepID=UPI00215039AF|nr:O-antigen ligase family protein [Providencia vermicola]MCR4181038.1 O-antigen ligase family protein [Providencia vermicola]